VPLVAASSVLTPAGVLHLAGPRSQASRKQCVFLAMTSSRGSSYGGWICRRQELGAAAVSEQKAHVSTYSILSILLCVRRSLLFSL